MTKNEIITQIKDLEELIPLSDDDFREKLLDDYTILVWALKSINDDWVWNHILDIQSKIDDRKNKLPELSEQEFDEYCLSLDFLGIFYEEVKND